MIEVNVMGDLWVATLVRPNVKYHVGTYTSEAEAVEKLQRMDEIYDSDGIDPLPATEICGYAK